MKEFKETNYDTVLDRIYIRAEIEGKWQNLSLRESLKHQDQLRRWLKKFTEGFFVDATPNIDITEKELIDIVKWLDGIKPPVRLKA